MLTYYIYSTDVLSVIDISCAQYIEFASYVSLDLLIAVFIFNFQIFVCAVMSIFFVTRVSDNLGTHYPEHDYQTLGCLSTPF